MTRAEALQSLIARVEAGEVFAVAPFEEAPEPLDANEVQMAHDGSLDAVARLEAPLRARNWFSMIEGNGGGEFYAQLQHHGRKVFGRAPSEARARLLAVLRALAAEEAAP